MRTWVMKNQTNYGLKRIELKVKIQLKFCIFFDGEVIALLCARVQVKYKV